jgi:hypothetical protein
MYETNIYEAHQLAGIAASAHAWKFKGHHKGGKDAGEGLKRHA